MKCFLSFIFLALLNMLVLSVGLTAQKAFSEVAVESGLSFDYVGYPYGGGISIGDFNDDGHEDIYLSNGIGQPNALFMNNGDGTFIDRAVESGVADTSAGMGVVCGDIDNDGDLDIFLSNHWAMSRLFLNDGTGIFSDATVPAGLDEIGPGTSVAMADYDLDGWLDIYQLRHAQDHIDYPNRLYRNRGDGRFDDVTEQSGAGGMSTSLAVGFFDFNGDLYPDIYVVNEYERDEVFLNNADGSFTNLRDEIVIPYGGGMGVDFADYDADGDIDVYVTNLYRDFLLRNEGGETLVDVTSAAGIENLTMGWGVSFLDYDNDADLDIHVVNGAMLWPESYDETNVFFRNNGNNYFNEVAEQVGLNSGGDSRASACADFNNDGYMDVVILNVDRGLLDLFQNTPGNNNWIKLKLEGTHSNRSGLGARVELRAGGQSQFTELRSGSSFGSNLSRILSFGLGNETTVQRIAISWPSGEEQVLTELDANQLLHVVEPGVRGGGPGVAASFELYQNYPNPFNPETAIGYSLMVESFIRLEIYNTAGQKIRTAINGQRSTGSYEYKWDGRNDAGKDVASGIYVYRLTINGAAQARKMILAR